METILTGRAAEYLLLELAAPGRPAVRIGVFLFDPACGRLEFRLRSDIAALAGGLEPEELDALSGLEAQIAEDIRTEGPAGYLHRLENDLSNILRIGERSSVVVRDFRYQLGRLFDEAVLGRVRERAPVLPFERHLPVYTLRAAAGKFGEDMEVEPEGWVEAPEGLRLAPDMFVAHVAGHSMEPAIPDGSLAVFRARPAGSRNGMRVLVWRPGASGGEFTLKVYRSKKTQSGDEWTHESIVLEPLNPDYETLVLDSGARYEVLGQFLRVLPPDAEIR